MRVKLELPHPLILLLGGVAIAALLTWILPAGEYDRKDDEATGRRIVVAGTYKPVDPAPVGPMAAFVALPRGFIEAADVVAVVLFVGGAWVVVDRLGTLTRLVGGLVRRFRGRGLVAIPVVSLFFAVMGALENMQEEIIALVPVLLVLGRGLGVNAVAVVAMSAGAAMIGSAFGPTNPFQAGIAMKLAELPAVSGAVVRTAMFVAGVALWIGWTMRYAARTRVAAADIAEPAAFAEASAPQAAAPATGKDVAIFLLVLAPMAAYVYGALAWGWGFNELSAGFFIAAMIAGIAGGLGIAGTSSAYLEGMQSMLPASVLIGITRSITVVLADGRVIDTILHGLAAPLAGMPAMTAALLMIPVHALIHVFVPSVSGQAVLTMPVLVPLSDILGISRQVTVVAYQTGAGLTELLTPTNGALMAILLAAGVPYDRWIRFAIGGVVLAGMVGVAGMAFV
jgi:uncharacterized ion transporter superfamily protein YfcC